MFRKLKGKVGEVIVTDEDKKVVDEVLTPYWAERDYATAYHREMPEDTRFLIYGPDPKNSIMLTAVLLPTSIMRHSQNWTPDFSKIPKARRQEHPRRSTGEADRAVRAT
jgi:formate C-acetyltransferase